MRVELLEDRRLLAVAQEVEPNDSQVRANAMLVEESTVIPGLIRNSITGEFSARERDFFSFPADAGDLVSVSVSGDGLGLDPRLSLRDAFGVGIIADRDSGPGQDSLAPPVSIDSSGTYYVRVFGDDAETAGSYQLNAIVARGLSFESDTDQRNNTKDGATHIPLAINENQITGKIAGTISSPHYTADDVDLFRISGLTLGVQASIDLTFPEWSTLDAVVEVLNSDGIVLADSDPSGIGFDGVFETDGVYYARVTGRSNAGPSAQYSLDVKITDTIAPSVTSISRLTDDPNLSNEIFATFTAQFSEPLSQESVAAAEYDLRESGIDGVFDTADDTVYSLIFKHVESENHIDFTVTDGPLGNGDYRLTLPSTITDLVGNSSDVGSGLVRRFTVDAIPDHGVFEGRDNHDYTKATSLELEADTNGTGWFRGEVGFGSIDALEDQDWWSFEGRVGDQIDVWAQDQAGGLRPNITLYRPGNDGTPVIKSFSNSRNNRSDIASISGVRLTRNGTHYVLADRRFAGTGGYDLRVNFNRINDVETDANQHNDQREDSLTFINQNNTRVATIAGTVISTDDRDRFSLGFLSAGVVVNLDATSLPHWSTLEPEVRVYRVDPGDPSNLAFITDTVTADNVFAGTLDADGMYVAEIRGRTRTEGPPTFGTGLDAHYVLDVTVTDPVAPMVALVNRLPDEGGSTAVLLSTFGVTFSEPIDETTLLDAGFDLRAAGVDGTFGTSDDIAYGLTAIYTASSFTLDFSVTDGPLADGEYQLTLPSSITDLFGNSVGDGSGLVRAFTVDAVPNGGVFEGSDNDDYKKATPLALEADTNGTGWLRSEVGYGSIDQLNDRDWWSFEGLAGDSVDVWAQERIDGNRPYVLLYQLSEDGTSLTKASESLGGGPGDTAYISGYRLPSDGTYYLRVDGAVRYYDPGSGGYDLRINVNRVNDVEYDLYSRNDFGSGNSVTFTGHDNTQIAKIAGTVISIDDEDRYDLGYLQAGRTVTVNAASLPQWSTLEPEVRVYRRDATNPVTDTEPADNVFTGLLETTGYYYAQVRTRTTIRDATRFTVVDDSASWADAASFAVSQGGQLVSIDSADKQAFIENTFGTGHWIGLNDAAEEGKFAWSDGTSLAFSDWYDTTPENANNASERDHVYLKSNDVGSWYVDSGDTSRTSLIQRPTDADDPTASGPGLYAQYLLNITVADLTPPVVTLVTGLPVDGGSTAELSSTFQVNFSEQLNKTTLADTVLDLRGTGQDGVFDTSDDIVFTLETTYSASYRNKPTLRFTITAGQVANGEHRLTLTDDLTDGLGNQLDGNHDDAAGGNFVRTFTVDPIPGNDIFEGFDNDDYTKATPLALEVDTNGTGWLRSEVGFGRINSHNDQDWWSFEGQAGDRVNIGARGQLDDPRFQITLYQPSDDGTNVTYMMSDSSTFTGGNAYIHGIELPSDGTYYVQVDQVDSTVPGAVYDLSINLNRTNQVESGTRYSGNSTGDSLTFFKQGFNQIATVAGTITSMGEWHRYDLGFQHAGTTITLDLSSLPHWSTLEPEVLVYRLTNTRFQRRVRVPVEETSNNVFMTNLDTDANYFAIVHTRTAVYDGSRFTLNENSLTWPDAEAFAVSQGGHLASIDSPQKQASISEHFGNNSPWTGLNDATEEGTFVWSDGTPFSYSNLFNSTPIESQNSDDRDYGFLWQYDAGSWSVDSGVAKRTSLIQLPMIIGGPLTSSPGLQAQYLLKVTATDLVPPVVTSVNGLPDEGDSTAALLSSFDLDFSEPLDETTLADGVFDLRATGPDGVFDTNDDVLFSLATTYSVNTSDRSIFNPGTVYGASTYELDFTVTDGPLGNGNYRLTLASSITDLFGNSLEDGSGLVRTFTVDAVSNGGVFEGSDNGDFFTATPLAMEQDTNGTGWFRSEIGYGSIDLPDDQDWWSFEGRAGDLVDVWAQTQLHRRSLYPYLTLYQLSEDGTNVTSLADDSVSGPYDTAYISLQELPSDGTYYVLVDGNSDSRFDYDVRINLSRTNDVESDSNFANDYINEYTSHSLTFVNQGITRTATIAGTVMSAWDEDRYSLGFLNSGTKVTIDAGLLPQWSTLEPEVRVYRVRPDNTPSWEYATDTEPADNVFTATLDADGTYFAEIRTRTAVYDGTRFSLTHDRTSWDDANAFAVSEGAQLVSIDSAQKQEFVTGTFGHFWIGLNDSAQEGTFVWSDGTPFSYAAWSLGSPEKSGNTDDRDHAYSYVSRVRGSSWRFSDATTTRYGLIQQPTVAGDPLASGPGLHAQYVLTATITDVIPPSLLSVGRLPDDGGFATVVADSFDINVSEPVELASLRSALTLTLDGQPVDLASVSISQAEPTRYEISGLASLMLVDGAYELTIDASQLADLIGLTGFGKTTHSWTLDTITPTTRLDAAVFTLAPLRYLVDIESEDTGTAPTGVAGVKIFTAAANQPLKLTNEIGPSVSPIIYVAPVDEDHVFFASASDVAGNVQPLLIDSVGAFTVNIHSELISELPDTLIIAEGTDSKFIGRWAIADPIIINGVMHHQLMVDDRTISVETSTPWRNPVLPQDVNHSGDVTILDALRILNRVNRSGSELPIPEASQEHAYLDVTGDGRVSVLDALRVINELSRQWGVAGEGEATELTATDEPSPKTPAAAIQNFEHVSPVDVDDHESVQVDFGLTPKTTPLPHPQRAPENRSVDEIFTAIGTDSGFEDDASESDRNDALSLLGSADRELN